ncbi:hypothetical protein [Enterococcus sp. DIV1420a]|uniref:hypothetical protein n=1 Tax=Enterococcus sp. DIV1420a TaxID=2774672 RepID=UPI003F25F3F8
MRHTQREIEWQNSRVKLLRELCLKYPYLNMNELAHRLQLSVEDVYQLIKEYDVPYCWKFQKEKKLIN